MKDSAEQEILGDTTNGQGSRPRRSNKTREEPTETHVNTEKKWEHLGKGEDGRPRGQPVEDSDALSILRHRGRARNHAVVKGRQGIKGPGAGSLHI